MPNELIHDTDLAVEEIASKRAAEKESGTEIVTETTDTVTITDIKIITEEAANELSKPCGRYITLEINSIDYTDKIESVISDTAKMLRRLIGIPLPKSVLVCGLGNRHIPPDALGARTIDNIAVTRVIADKVGLDSKFSVAAIAPGVLGVTGIETAEIIQSVTDKISPDIVIVIDSLCARDIKRIGNTIQMTDTEIRPGAGLGNRRNVISSDVLGKRVISIGVPTVVYAKTVFHNIMELLVRKEGIGGEASVDSLLHGINDKFINELVVTPKDIDSLINNSATVIAGAINKVFKTEEFCC